jgi:uncharacterized membrane protein YkoI
MKRSTIVAAVAAVADRGGGAAAGAAMSGGSSVSPAAQELRPVGDEHHDDRDDHGDGDDRDTRGQTPEGPAGEDSAVRQVIATALAAAPGHVVEVDLDDDGRHWEVEIAGDDRREHELEISLDGTTVLEHERDDDDDDVREERALLKGAAVQAADAARIAEERFGGRVHDLDLDADDRVWDVELRDAAGAAWELEIDVRTGQIRDVEQDD